MSFPQLPFGGLKSRRISFLNSNLVLQPLQLGAIAGELKYANSDLELASIESQVIGGILKVGSSDLVLASLILAGNIDLGTALNWRTITDDQWRGITDDQWREITDN